MPTFTPRQQFMLNGRLTVITRFRVEGRIEVEDVKTGAPETVQISYLLQEYMEQRLIFVTENDAVAPKKAPKLGQRDLGSYGNNLAQTARERLKFLKLFAYLPRGQRCPAIRSYLEEVEAGTLKWEFAIRIPSFSTSKRWLHYYEFHEHDVRALVSQVNSRGGPGKSRLPPALEQIVIDMINQVYLVPEDANIDQVLAAIRVQVKTYNQLHEDDSDFKPLKTPGRTTVHQRILKVDPLKLSIAELGPREAKRRYKQRHKVRLAEFPNERWEIDHSPWDLIIVGIKLRLWVTVVIDYATKIIPGYALSPIKAGYLSATECLYHGILPKVGYKEKFNLDHEWIGLGRPGLLAVDGAREFISDSFDDALESIHITKEQMTGDSPEDKGTVERMIGTIQGEAHTKPGTTFSNPIERDQYDSIAMARLSLEQAERDFIKHLVDVYSQSKHRGTGVIPALEWERKTKFGFFPDLPKSPKKLLIDFGRKQTACLFPYGVQRAGEIYNSDALAELRAKLEYDKSESRKLKEETNKWTKHPLVEYKIHPGDASRIYVYDPYNDDHIEAPVEGHPDGELKNMSLWEHAIIRKLQLKLGDQEDKMSIAEAREDLRRSARPDSRQGARLAYTPPSLRAEGSQEASSAKARGGENTKENEDELDVTDLSLTPEDYQSIKVRTLNGHHEPREKGED